MKSVVLTTAIRNINKGVVTDSNLVEYPDNSATILKDVEILDNDVVSRRPGLHPDSMFVTSITTVDEHRAEYWEYAPGKRLVIAYAPDGAISVNWTPLATIAGPNLTDCLPNTTYSVEYWSKTLPSGPLVTISASEWFNNVEHRNSVCSTSYLPGGAMVTHYYDKAGTRYYRRTKVLSTTLTSTLARTSQGSYYSSSCVTSAVVNNTMVVTGVNSWPMVYWVDEDEVLRADIVPVSRRRYEDLPDGIGNEEKPASTVVNANFEANLRSRGWQTAELTAYKTATGTWPSKSMLPWRGKDNTGTFAPAELDKLFFNTSSAPTGSTIQILQVDDVTTPNWVEAAAGRFWYAGFSGKAFSNQIAYSQPIQSKAFMAAQAGACYSYNDPTSEYLNEPTAFDGGFIKIEAADQIIGLKAFKDGVLAFARNGVWYIYGQSGVFSGNSFSVYKVTNAPVLSAKGVVETDTSVLFAARDGIYEILPDPQQRSLVPVCITDRVRSKEWRDLLNLAVEEYTVVDMPFSQTYRHTTRRVGCLAAYDKVKKRALFCPTQDKVIFDVAYSVVPSSAAIDFVSEPLGDVWVYDVARTAFYDFSSWPAYFVRDFVVDFDGRCRLLGANWTFSYSGSTGANAFKDAYTYSPYGAPVYREYTSRIEISAKNSVLDPQKQIVAVHSTFQNSDYESTTPGTYITGSCLFSAAFDNWSGFSARVSPEEQAYRHVPGREPNYGTGKIPNTVKTRLKVRGAGTHYKIKYRSEGQKDFKMVGYQLDLLYPVEEFRRVAMASQGE